MHFNSFSLPNGDTFVQIKHACLLPNSPNRLLALVLANTAAFQYQNYLLTIDISTDAPTLVDSFAIKKEYAQTKLISFKAPYDPLTDLVMVVTSGKTEVFTYTTASALQPFATPSLILQADLSTISNSYAGYKVNVDVSGDVLVREATGETCVVMA